MEDQMHPNKAEALGQLAEVSREFDAEIDHLGDVVQHPGRNGWRTSLAALAVLPFLGAGAVLVDATDVSFRRISDSRWGDAPEG